MACNMNTLRHRVSLSRSALEFSLCCWLGRNKQKRQTETEMYNKAPIKFNKYGKTIYYMPLEQYIYK